MRNVSLLFSFITLSFFILVTIFYLITEDKTSIEFGWFSVLFFLILSTLSNSLTFDTDEDKIKEKYERDNEHDRLYDRISSVESQMFEDLANQYRKNDDATDALWREIHKINDSIDRLQTKHK